MFNPDWIALFNSVVSANEFLAKLSLVLVPPVPKVFLPLPVPLPCCAVGAFIFFLRLSKNPPLKILAIDDKA